MLILPQAFLHILLIFRITYHNTSLLNVIQVL
jgi:hypothetical protein